LAVAHARLRAAPLGLDPGALAAGSRGPPGGQVRGVKPLAPQQGADLACLRQRSASRTIFCLYSAVNRRRRAFAGTSVPGVSMANAIVRSAITLYKELRRPGVSRTLARRAAQLGEIAPPDALSAPLINVPGVTANANPPDTVLDAGPNHIVQMTNNTGYIVYDKQGNPIPAGTPNAAIRLISGLWPAGDVARKTTPTRSSSMTTSPTGG
jgi:hypothetical protein